MSLYVLFRVGDASYALEGSDVIQLESFTGATRVPGTATHVVGLVQLRNQLMPVVDLRARFGLSPIEPSLDSRVIVVRRSDRLVALLADSAREVADIDPATFAPPPDAVLRQANGFVRAITHVSGRIVMLIDVERVIGHEESHGQPHTERA